VENQFSKYLDKKDFFFQLGQNDAQDGKYRSRDEISMLPDVGQVSEDDFQEYLSGYEVGEEDYRYYGDLYELDRESLLNFINEEEVELDEKKKKKSKGKKDACYHKVRARYDVWPSAYASGALVKCRKVGAANWGNKSKKNESLEMDDYLLQVIQEEYQAVLAEKKKKAGSESSKESNLRDWFKRKGAPGKKGGWVDCNTCRKGKCKPCGRSGKEKRSKYPSCRPTPSACKERGRGKSWGKKSKSGKK